MPPGNKISINSNFRSMIFNIYGLTLEAPIITAADDIHKYFFHCLSEKIRLDVSSESSARQRIHMKNQALFSLKDVCKKLTCCLLQFLFGTIRAKVLNMICHYISAEYDMPLYQLP